MTRRILCCLFTLTVGLTSFSQSWDFSLTKSINPQSPGSDYWRTTSGSLYFAGAGVPLYLLTRGLIKKDAALKHKAYEVLETAVFELLLSEPLKEMINEKRPAEKHPGSIHSYRNVHGKSFPSGHTSMAFATAASLSIQYKKWYVTVPAYAWAATVGYSRIYLGVHYPSDVIVGAAVGIGSAYLAHWVNRKFFSRQKHVNLK